jgi:hypothetical protein
LVEQITEWKTRRDFYLAFSESPVVFIQKWLISQSADLKAIEGNDGDAECERRAEFFTQPCIDEAVHRYYYAKVLSIILRIFNIIITGATKTSRVGAGVRHSQYINVPTIPLSSINTFCFYLSLASILSTE